jgi:hypothetical protein
VLFTVTLGEFKTNQAGSLFPAGEIGGKTESMGYHGIHHGW